MNAPQTFMAQTFEGSARFGNCADDGSIIPPITASRRSDGWTPDRQRSFLELVAIGHTVENACRAVGLTPQSAYAFRARAAGAAFAVGWHAATLLQRQKLADALTLRALEGQTVTVTRPDGSTVERHYFDNRLATTMLARADKLANGETPDRFGEGHAARLAAGEWEGFLDLVASDAGPARAGAFLALRRDDGVGHEPEGLAAATRLARADCYQRTGTGLPAEVDTADLDLAARATWTADQWARAEAAGLLRLAAPEPQADPQPADAAQAGGDPQLPQHSLPDRGDDDGRSPVWWSREHDAWHTWFPAPDDFEGTEWNDAGDLAYERELTDAEWELVEACCTDSGAVDRAAEGAERDAYFAALAERVAAPSAAPEPAADPPVSLPSPRADEADAWITRS